MLAIMAGLGAGYSRVSEPAGQRDSGRFASRFQVTYLNNTEAFSSFASVHTDLLGLLLLAAIASKSDADLSALAVIGSLDGGLDLASGYLLPFNDEGGLVLRGGLDLRGLASDDFVYGYVELPRLSLGYSWASEPWALDVGVSSGISLAHGYSLRGEAGRVSRALDLGAMWGPYLTMVFPGNWVEAKFNRAESEAWPRALSSVQFLWCLLPRHVGLCSDVRYLRDEAAGSPGPSRSVQEGLFVGVTLSVGAMIGARGDGGSPAVKGASAAPIASSAP